MGGSRVKITKNKLKQLIKEQYEAAMLQEASDIPKNISRADLDAYIKLMKSREAINPNFIRADLDKLEARVNDLEEIVISYGKLLNLRGPQNYNTDMKKRVNEGVRPDMLQEQEVITVQKQIEFLAMRTHKLGLEDLNLRMAIEEIYKRIEVLEKVAGQTGKVQKYSVRDRFTRQPDLNEGMRPDVFQEVMDELE